VFRRFSTIFFCITITSLQATAQNVIVRSRFYTDSLKIGEVVPFSLTARYPSSVNVLFPDSSFSFAPFELQNKKYFRTKTQNHLSYDSVVYFLRTYEIDSAQKLNLPVFLVNPNDCTKVYGQGSSIILKQLVKAVPDSVTAEQLPLKTNTRYRDVRWLLNYPLLIFVLGLLLVALIIVWIVFGKRIRRYFRLRRLTKTHQAFLSRFSQSLDQLKAQFSSEQAETVFVIWKKYMENLVSRPYTKYTAREILQLEHDEQLGFTLAAINQLIYGGINSAAEKPFIDLRAYTEQMFVRKLEEIRHG